MVGGRVCIWATFLDEGKNWNEAMSRFGLQKGASCDKEEGLDLGMVLEWDAHPPWRRAKAMSGKCSLTFNAS